MAVIKRGESYGRDITWPSRSTLALVGLGIVVVGVTGYALTRPGPGHIQSAVAESGVRVVSASVSASAPASRSTSPPTSHAASPSASASASPTPTPKPSPAQTPATNLRVALPKGPVSAIVFGDSYVAGVGASAAREAFTEQAMTQLGWSATYFARDDSGYCTSHSLDYLQRLKAIPPGPAPTVFVLEGGINDTACNAAVLSAQISASITQIKTAYPKAALIVLGPVVPSKYSANQLVPVDNALEAAATAARVPYISPLTELWFTSANRAHYMSPDGVNPNQAGYAYLTTVLLRDLEQITGT
jgi:acyl-CoA thioesterase I